MMKDCDTIIDVEGGEKLIYTENKDVIHRNINENQIETTQDKSEEAIDKYPYDISPSVMKNGVNEEQEYRNRIH